MSRFLPKKSFEEVNNTYSYWDYVIYLLNNIKQKIV